MQTYKPPIKVELNVNWRRSFIPWGHLLLFDGKFQIEAFQIPILADNLLRLVIDPFFISQSESLINIKGADPSSWGQMKIQPTSGVDPEIFYAAGVLHCDDRKASSLEPFWICIKSKFKGFIGAHEIEYSATESHSRIIPEGFPLVKIAWSVPLEITGFQFGFDIFTSSFTTMLGLAPSVTQSFRFVASREGFEFLIRIEGLKSKSTDGIFKGGLWSATLEWLTKTCNINLLTSLNST